MSSSRSLLREYPELILLEKGVQGLANEVWIDMINRRSRKVCAVIKKVEHYKCTNGFEHEFLAVHLKHPANKDSNRQIILFIERTVRPTIWTPLGFSSPSAVAPIPASDLITIPAPQFKDPIAFIDKEHKEHMLLSSLEFPVKPPSDRDLSLIVDFATTQHPEYDKDYQCFWYAGLIFDALMDKFGGQKRNTTNADRRGYFKTFKAPIGDGWAKLKGEYENWKSLTESK